MRNLDFLSTQMVKMFKKWCQEGTEKKPHKEFLKMASYEKMMQTTVLGSKVNKV